MKHTLFTLMKELELCDENSLAFFNDRVRDSDKIKAYRCQKSGVIILDTIDQGEADAYENKSEFEYWDQAKELVDSKFHDDVIQEDDRRRADQFKDVIAGKKWLDFGAGKGGCLLVSKGVAGEGHGLEIQPGPRKFLNDQGVKCFGDLDELEDSYYDVITLFHVLEHLTEPVEILKKLKTKLKSDGRMIIEVPHARDALLTKYSSEAFKNFTLWSEHLLLHTKVSLEKFIAAADLGLENLTGYQRYPLSNHMYWLAHQAPGGHEKWNDLDSPELSKAYEKKLQELDLNDTLIAICRNS